MAIWQDVILIYYRSSDLKPLNNGATMQHNADPVIFLNGIQGLIAYFKQYTTRIQPITSAGNAIKKQAVKRQPVCLR
jgi:hypothetical protein